MSKKKRTTGTSRDFEKNSNTLKFVPFNKRNKNECDRLKKLLDNNK